MRQSRGDISYRVCERLDHEKVFLDPDLSLAKFSAMVGTNTTYLSNTINDRFGCNFHTLINNYRIQYVAELLRTGERKENRHTLGGFVSKRAFYDAFVKRMGQSPLRYQRECLAQLESRT